MSIEQIKADLQMLPGNRFVAAMKATEKINAILDGLGQDALLVAGYCKLTREAKVMAAASFPLTPSANL